MEEAREPAAVKVAQAVRKVADIDRIQRIAYPMLRGDGDTENLPGF
jgi:hypothetical protein